MALRRDRRGAAWLAAAAVAWCAMACTPMSRRRGAFAPQTPGYAYADGTLFHRGRAVAHVVEYDIDVYTTRYDLVDPRGAPIARVTFASWYEHTLQCRAEFPGAGWMWTARIPVMPFTALLASFIDRGVLRDSGVDAAALERYATDVLRVPLVPLRGAAAPSRHPPRRGSRVASSR